MVGGIVSRTAKVAVWVEGLCMHTDKHYLWHLAGVKEWKQYWVFDTYHGEGHHYGYAVFGNGDGYKAWMVVYDQTDTAGNGSYEY